MDKSRLLEAIRAGCVEPFHAARYHKDAPSAPAPPDYAGAAQAQGAANVETARAQGRMNNPNVYTPYGSQQVTWGGDGPATFSWNGNTYNDRDSLKNSLSQYATQNNYTGADVDKWLASPSTYGINQTSGTPSDQPTVTQTLAPAQQQLLDAQNRISGNLANVAETGLNRVSQGFDQPFNTSGLPLQQSNVQGGNYQSSVGFNPMQSSYDQGGQVRYDAGYNNPIQGQIAGAGSINNSYQGGGPVQSGFSSGGNVQQGFDPAGRQQASYDQGGQVRYDAGYNQPIQNSFNAGGNVQQGFDTAGRQQGQLGDVGGPQRGLDFGGAPGIPGINDFGRERDQVTNALLSRSEPQFQRDEELTRTRLINQGIAPGAEASNYDLDTLNRARNDARMQATLAGSQEQSRLANLAMAARGQYTGEQAQQGQFANNAQNQAFTQGLAGGQFANQAQQAQYGQNLGAMQAANAAQGQQYAQNQGLAGFQNAAQAQGFGQAQTNLAAYNAAQAQANQQGLQAGQFANLAQQNQYGQNLGAMQANNAALAQQFGQNQAQGQFANAAQQQANQQALQAAQFGNTAQQQQFGQNQAQGEFANSAQNIGYQQAQGNLAAYNTAQGQANQQGLQAGQFANQAAQGNFGMGQQNAALNNQVMQQQFQQGLANANLSNQGRQQQIQEQAYLRSLPLNELNALRTGAQVQNPQFQPYQGTEIGQTPVFNAAQAQAQANQNQYNQQVDSNNAFTGGLFSLGAGALGGPAGGFLSGLLRQR